MAAATMSGIWIFGIWIFREVRPHDRRFGDVRDLLNRNPNRRHDNVRGVHNGLRDGERSIECRD